MIHVCTIHHRDGRFVALQAEALNRWLREPYTVHTVADGVTVPADWHQVQTSDTRHGQRLDHLARTVTDLADPDDLLIFLDGDAWPIAEPAPRIRAALTGGWLLAVARLEGAGAGWPHPSFCATTVARWVELGASWVPATWPDQSVKHRFDVGVNVLIRLGARPWKRLLRANTRNPHPLFFGVYGDPPLIYHHGAGFRPPFSSRDGRETTSATRAERLAHNETLSRELHQAATVDPDFWRCLCE